MYFLFSQHNIEEISHRFLRTTLFFFKFSRKYYLQFFFKCKMDLDSFLNRSVGDLNNLPREVICNVFSNISHISEIIRIGNKFPQFLPFLRQCVTHVDFRNGNPIFDQDYFSDDETVSLRTLYGILDTFKILKEVKVSLFDVSEKRIISLLTNPIIRDLKIEFNNNSSDSASLFCSIKMMA